jgi:hypothetical protein
MGTDSCGADLSTDVDMSCLSSGGIVPRVDLVRNISGNERHETLTRKFIGPQILKTIKTLSVCTE